MSDKFDDADKLIPDDMCLDENSNYIDESNTPEALPWANRPNVPLETRSDRIQRHKRLTHTPLNPKEEQFVVEYLKDKNQTQAAIRAGYPAKSARSKASQLMAKPNIQTRAKEQLDKVKKKTFQDAEIILQDIYDIGTRCMEKEPVLDNEGNPIGVWKFDSQGALRSRELLGKHLELFTDKVKQQGETVLNIVVHKNDKGKLEKQ